MKSSFRNLFLTIPVSCFKITSFCFTLSKFRSYSGISSLFSQKAASSEPNSSLNFDISSFTTEYFSFR